MLMGDRLRALRVDKKFSQGDLELRTGLKRCYISRVENGHTIPSVETLEKFARALEIPVYQLFYEGDEPPEVPAAMKGHSAQPLWGSHGRDARLLTKFRELLSHITVTDRDLLLHMAQKMFNRRQPA